MSDNQQVEVVPGPLNENNETGDIIELNVWGVGKSVVKYRMEKTSMFSIVYEHYSYLSGIRKDDLLFNCKRHIIRDNETPLELGMQNNDVILVFRRNRAGSD